MNKNLFWTGIMFQIIHLLGIVVLFVFSINWNVKLLLGIGYVLFNILSLMMILIGAIIKED